MNPNLIRETFYDIITGSGVKRSVHDLFYQGTDYRELFISCLMEKDYKPVTPNEVAILPGERYPAFYLPDSIAYFGHLFIEVFNERRQRKIWGSVIRNEKGDWKYIIPASSTKIIYLNQSKLQHVDILHLT